jgi:hypothetical protein
LIDQSTGSDDRATLRRSGVQREAPYTFRGFNMKKFAWLLLFLPTAHFIFGAIVPLVLIGIILSPFILFGAMVSLIRR